MAQTHYGISACVPDEWCFRFASMHSRDIVLTPGTKTCARAMFGKEPALLHFRQRKPKVKYGAATWLVVGPNPAAMRFNDCAGN